MIYISISVKQNHHIKVTFCWTFSHLIKHTTASPKPPELPNLNTIPFQMPVKTPAHLVATGTGRLGENGKMYESSGVIFLVHIGNFILEMLDLYGFVWFKLTFH